MSSSTCINLTTDLPPEWLAISSAAESALFEVPLPSATKIRLYMIMELILKNVV